MNKRYLHLLFLAPIIIGTSCSSYNSSIKRANQQLELYNFKDAAYEFSQAWEKKEDNETGSGEVILANQAWKKKKGRGCVTIEDNNFQ